MQKKKSKLTKSKVLQIGSVTSLSIIICPSRSFTPKRMKNQGFPGYIFFCYTNVHFVIATAKKCITNNVVVIVIVFSYKQRKLYICYVLVYYNENRNIIYLYIYIHYYVYLCVNVFICITVYSVVRHRQRFYFV